MVRWVPPRCPFTGPGLDVRVGEPVVPRRRRPVLAATTSEVPGHLARARRAAYSSTEARATTVRPWETPPVNTPDRLRRYAVASDTFNRSAAWSTSTHGESAGSGVRGRGCVFGFSHMPQSSTPVEGDVYGGSAVTVDRRRILGQTLAVAKRWHCRLGIHRYKKVWDRERKREVKECQYCGKWMSVEMRTPPGDPYGQ